MAGIFRRRPRIRPRRSLAWLGVTAAGGANTLTTDLVAHWDLDEAANATRVDQHGSYDLTDANSNTGQDASGKISNGADFTNQATTTYLTHSGNDSALGAAGGIHVAGWVKPASGDLSGFVGLVVKYASAGNGSWRLGLNGGNPVFLVSDGTLTDDVTWGSALSEGEWYYIDAYYDLAGDEIGISVDRGTYVTQDVSALGTIQDGTDDLAFGARSDGGAWKFDGSLDEWALWSTKKSTADLDAAYNSGSGLAYASWLPAAPAPSGVANSLMMMGAGV